MTMGCHRDEIIVFFIYLIEFLVTQQGQLLVFDDPPLSTVNHVGMQKNVVNGSSSVRVLFLKL